MTTTSRPVLPISLYLADKRVLLVGSTERTSERVDRMSRAGAHLIRVDASEFQAELCADVFLVMADTGDRDRDAAIATSARRRGCLAYAHDQPSASDFAMPAVARHGPLCASISTDGTAPALARRLRQLLQTLFDNASSTLDQLLDDMAQGRRAAPSDARTAYLRSLGERLHLRGRLEVTDETDQR